MQAIKAQRGRSRTDLLILNINTKWRSVVASSPTHFPSREGTPQYPLTNGLGRNKKAFWTFWRTEKSLAPVRNGTSDCPAHCLVTRLTILCQLLSQYKNLLTSNFLTLEDVRWSWKLQAHCKNIYSMYKLVECFTYIKHSTHDNLASVVVSNTKSYY